MNKTIYILRSAPYNYLVRDYDLYDSFEAVANGIIDANIKPMTQTQIKSLKRLIPLPDRVYCSPKKRSIQTAKFLTNNPIPINLLQEVEYHMSEFIARKDFFDVNGKPLVDKARQQFVQGLINDNLSERYVSVINRSKQLINLLLNNTNNNVCCISHGFFMKIFEAYIKDPSIENYPEKLLKHFSGNDQTFTFTSGYKARINEKTIEFNSYLE